MNVHALREPRRATVCLVIRQLGDSPVTEIAGDTLDPFNIFAPPNATTYAATVPNVNPSGFSNPSLGSALGYGYGQPTPQQQQAAAAAAAPYGQAPGRATDAYGNPIAAPAGAAPAAPAPSYPQFDRNGNPTPTDSFGNPQVSGPNSGFNGGYKPVSNLPMEVGEGERLAREAAGQITGQPAAAPMFPTAPQGDGGLRTALLQSATYDGGRVAPGASRVQVQAPQGAVAGRVEAGQATAGQIDQSLLFPGQQMTGTSFANTQGARAQQQGAAGLLHSAATGAVPSAAEQQQQQGLQQAMRNNLSLAASARGTAGNRAAAQRAATDANTAAAMGVTGQAATLRATEQATARGQLAQALEGIRAGDLNAGGLGIQQQQVGLGVGNANLNAGTQTQFANLNAGTQTALANLGANTQTQLANLGAGTQLAQAQLSADQNIELANLDAQLRQTGMNDAARLQSLAQVLGIDARTQEGQIALQRLLAESHTAADAINAKIAIGNTDIATQKDTANAGMLGDALALFGM